MRTVLISLAIVGAVVVAALAWLGWWIAALLVAAFVLWGLADTYCGRPVRRVGCYHVHHHRHHH